MEETRERKKSEPMEQKKMPGGAEWRDLAKGWDNADRSEGERVRESQENISSGVEGIWLPTHQ